MNPLAALIYSFLFRLLHGILPDEHTWPITFSYAMGGASGKEGMKAGLYFSAAFTVQRMLISELAYLALAPFLLSPITNGIVYVVVGVAMAVAGAMVLRQNRYPHLHFLGKSTTINMLCTLLRPTAGRAVVNGYDILTQPDAVRQSIGLIFQDPSLDDRLTGRENLQFHATLYDVPGDVFKQRSADLLEMVDLADKADEVIRNYSGGMKRRLEIARGLLHRPKVLFLDEPTIGLDPQTRRYIWEYLLKLREQEGVTMFMTTHYMDEAENCDRIAVIDYGEIVALDTPAALKTLVGGDVVAVRTSDNRQAAEKLRVTYGVESRIGPDGQLIIEIAQGGQFIPQMMATLANTGTPLNVQSVNLRRPTLEDVFIKLTGRAIREEEADARDQMRQMSRMWRR